MPGRDGTGPMGKGPATGRGAGIAAGNTNQRIGRKTFGNSGRRGGAAAGPEGYCVCPECGEKAGHLTGSPCTSMMCPHCGTPMVRKV
ncbi:MAG: DUF5320 domain-containing protein [Clostridia bacterium]|nr:DUF5320 domain-containing protein [Clostridia bacterium]